jgi:hypothetical protein
MRVYTTTVGVGGNRGLQSGAHAKPDGRRGSRTVSPTFKSSSGRITADAWRATSIGRKDVIDIVVSG